MRSPGVPHDDCLRTRGIILKKLENGLHEASLPNGKKVQVPFDQMIVFTTNLEPRDLVDDAFLRRIPYKIEVIDLVKAPELAKAHQILAIPTLVREVPEPIKRVIGDLSDESKALLNLDLDALRG